MNFLKHLVFRIFHGWNTAWPPLSAADVQDGKVPAIWRQWLSAMQEDVGQKMTAYYLRPIRYADTFEALVTRVVIVNSIPGNAAARGTMQRLVDNTTTLTLTTHSMNQPIYVQHELLHAMQYVHNELFGPTGLKDEFSGDHWPLIFSPYGTH